MKTAAIDAHPEFQLLRSREIPALKLLVGEYRHRGTGAMHLHLSSASRENVFMVALRTIPEDSCGVAHILEHTALCGSRRFPVRDPFFMMLRRSLNSFMNAFTGSDWTAYPFATQNRQDFDNLLQVYLDAVFFARLDPLDFAQEGHRMEFATPDDASSELVFRGVVYNEMKGAMSAVSDQVYHSLCSQLYPSTTYRHNSGGDPAAIPELSHQQLLDFYRRHYHPSNASFMTFGDIPAAEHQDRFAEHALRHFSTLDGTIAVPREQRFSAPREAEDRFEIGDTGSLTMKHHILFAWLLGESTDMEHLAEVSLANGVLLDNSASPLRTALERSELGRVPSSLCGLLSEHRELVFICGLEDSEAEHADGCQLLVFDTLEQIAERGVDQQLVDSVLHQFELHSRKISGGRMPYGLQCLLRCLPAALYRGDPFAALDIDSTLDTLRQRSQNPQLIPELVRTQLLDNPHRLRLIMHPDPQLAQRREQSEKTHLQILHSELDEAQCRQLIEQAQQLEQRQQQSDDPDLLPRLSLNEVPSDIPSPEPYRGGAEHPSAPCIYTCGTNGLVYKQWLLPLPDFSEQQLQLLPLYVDFVTEVGIGEADYLSVQRRQAAVCGEIGMSSSMHGGLEDEQQFDACLTLAATGLVRNHQALSELMFDTLARARFDELPRLRELLAFYRNGRERTLTDNGHLLAMRAALSALSPSAALAHRSGGLLGIRSVCALDRQVAEPQQLQLLAEQLQTIHEMVCAAPAQLLLVTDEEQLAECAIGEAEQGLCRRDPLHSLQPSPLRASSRQLWWVDSQVNFCARAWPAVPLAHPDAPAFAVLAEFLRHGFLHRTIRESGGAYGGGARYDSGAAAFCCYSYRDPRREETLEDFERSLVWLQQEEPPSRLLEESILSVISALDKPGSPAGEAIADFHNRRRGYTPEFHRRYRRAVLATQLADLRRVAAAHLQADRASTAVIAPRQQGQALIDAGLELHTLEAETATAAVA